MLVMTIHFYTFRQIGRHFLCTTENEDYKILQCSRSVPERAVGCVLGDAYLRLRFLSQCLSLLLPVIFNPEFLSTAQHRNSSFLQKLKLKAISYFVYVINDLFGFGLFLFAIRLFFVPFNL